MYFLHDCIYPANGTEAIIGMCDYRMAWQDFDPHRMLQLADGYNAVFPGVNSSATHPSATTTIISSALGPLNSSGPFFLQVFGAMLSAVGTFWIHGIFRRDYIGPLVSVGLATAFELGAAAWVHTIAARAKNRLVSVDPAYVTDVHVGGIFVALSWSVAIATTFCFVTNLWTAWLWWARFGEKKRHERSRGWYKQPAENKESQSIRLIDRFLWRRRDVEIA